VILAATESSGTYIEISYGKDGSEITKRYVVAVDILRQAELWSAEKAPGATAWELDSWIKSKGAKLLDYADGPAIITVGRNGSRREDYFHDNQCVKTEIIAPLTAIRGVKVSNAPPPRPAP
jgi:hypothetical protein